MAEATHDTKGPKNTEAAHQSIGGEFGSETAGAALQPHVDPSALTPDAILYLQRVAGNRAVQRLVEDESARMAAETDLAQTPTVQHSLSVGPVDDPFEREAEAIAAEVQREITAPPTVDESQTHDEEDDPVAAIQPPRAKPAATVSMRKPQTTLRRASDSSAGFDAGPDFERKLDHASMGGRALPGPVRGHMEARLVANFKDVRVHAGPDAVQLSRDIQAQAFTHGSDIYFNAGKYAPGTLTGKRLLAHELTHVVQQGAAPPVQTKREPPARAFASHEVAVRRATQQPDQIQRLLLPQAARAFEFATSINPKYEFGKKITDHYLNTATITNEAGESETAHIESGVDNVTADEQKKLMDLGSGQSVFGRLFGRKKKQTDEQE